MPSNENLTKSILEIDEKYDLEGKNNAEMIGILKELRLKQSILELDENADLEGKDFGALTAMLAELKPEAGDSAKEGAEAKVEAKAQKKADEKAAKKKKKPPFTIAAGKSITTKRGILADGDEIKAADLAGGSKAINDFVETGHIDKN